MSLKLVLSDFQYVLSLSKQDTKRNMSREEFDCKLPFVEKGGECNTTIFEKYESFLSVLRYCTLVEFGLLLFLLFAVLFAYVGSYISKKKSTSGKGRGKSSQQDRFFAYNTSSLIFSALSTAGLWFFAYNGFLLDLEFDSPEGRINAWVLFLSYNSFFIANYSFLPVLKELMGSFAFSNQQGRRFYLGLKIGFIYPIVVVIPFVMLLYTFEPTIPYFLSYCFVAFIFQTLLLVYLLLTIIDTVIRGIKGLESRYGANPTNEEQVKTAHKLRVLSAKLKQYKKSVIAQSTMFLLSLGVLVVPALTSKPEVLLRYIIPGADRCISYGTPGDSLNRKHGTDGSVKVSVNIQQTLGRFSTTRDVEVSGDHQSL
eukprot:snap_masked-scaffold_2-processed-gene-0.22-mRNA-1 protein AED:1.00 eAED:1.00 QI:0/0/0/0/1/1/2/0/368